MQKKNMLKALKGRIALLLAMIMVLSVAGCGKTAGEQKGSDPTVVENTGDGAGQENTGDTTDDGEEAEAGDEDSLASADGAEAGEEVVEVLPPTDLYIKELFAEHGIKAGTCLTTAMINDPDQSKLILEQFNSITMENSMKPDYLFNKEKSIETGDLVVEFNSDMIKMLDWAKENGMAVRGHTLVWHSQTPNWIFYKGFDAANGLVDRDTMLARMDSYFSQVFSKLEEMGYIDLFYAYDVVNEAWMEDGTMRESKWKETIGDDYLWQAFNCANKYAPESIDLYYNDYNEQFKTATLVKFAKTLVDEDGNYLIDGIGFQAHLYTSDDIMNYFSTVDTIAGLGLKVELTELDVCLGAYQKQLFATDENIRTQGRYYYMLINDLLDRIDSGKINMDAITFWGFADNLSWRKEYSPLLYNKKLEPKYAFYGVMQEKKFAGFDE